MIHSLAIQSISRNSYTPCEIRALQCMTHKHTEDIDVYEIFLTTLSVTALKPLGGAMAQWRKRAGEHPRVDARDARGTNR